MRIAANQNEKAKSVRTLKLFPVRVEETANLHTPQQNQLTHLTTFRRELLDFL